MTEEIFPIIDMGNAATPPINKPQVIVSENYRKSFSFSCVSLQKAINAISGAASI